MKYVVYWITTGLRLVYRQLAIGEGAEFDALLLAICARRNMVD